MVYGTLRAHRADIEIQSAPGQGTRVVITFPSLPRPAGAAEPQGFGATAGDKPSASLSILLVDDDPLIRETVPALLGTMGHDVVPVAGGQEALEFLRTALEVDLVILDMNMPGMNGAEALSRILAAHPHQAVLLASGYNDQDIQQLVHDHPRVLAIQKPFTHAELLAKLAEFQASCPPPAR
jgi:CheY-like chemotaxis protein